MSDLKPNLPPRPSLPPRPQKPSEDFSLEKNVQEQQVESQIQDNLQTTEQNQNIVLEQEATNTYQEIPQETQVKNNKKGKSKKKIIIFIGVVLFVASILLTVIIATIIGIVVFNSRNNKKLEINNANLQVLELSDKIYLKAQNLDCEKYVFELFDGKNTSLVKSQASLYEITDFVEVGKTYSFKFYIEGKTEKTRSEASKKVVYLHKKQLGKPNVRLSQDNTSIIWDAVENATSYRIYYYNNESHSVEYKNITSENNLITYTPSFVIGSTVFQVIAISEEEGYLTSELSNPVKIVTQEKEVSPTKVEVNRESCIITITMPEISHNPTFIVKIADNTYKFTTTEIKSIYQISLTTFTDYINLGQTVFVGVQARNDMFQNSSMCSE